LSNADAGRDLIAAAMVGKSTDWPPRRARCKRRRPADRLPPPSPL